MVGLEQPITLRGESTKLSYIAGEGAATTLPPLGETLFLKQIVLVNPYQKMNHSSWSPGFLLKMGSYLLQNFSAKLIANRKGA